MKMTKIAAALSIALFAGVMMSCGSTAVEAQADAAVETPAEAEADAQ